MNATVPRLLLTGSPQVGKSTLIRAVTRQLTDRGAVACGFITQDSWEDGERVGFTVADLRGQSALLAHVSLIDGPWVGRYRVDVAAFEAIALPAISHAATSGGVAIIDELGQMQLLSEPFIGAILRLLDQPIPLLATVHSRSHPVTDLIKHSPGVEMLEVGRGEAADLRTDLTARFAAYGPPS